MSNIARFDILRVLQYTSLTNSYIALGIPFDHAMRTLHFINNTDAIIYISFDGINDNTAIMPMSFDLYDVTSNQDQNEHFRYQDRTQVMVKYEGSAPTSGAVYLTAIYGKGE